MKYVELGEARILKPARMSVRTVSSSKEQPQDTWVTLGDAMSAFLSEPKNNESHTCHPLT